MINGKFFYLTEEQIQAHLDKEDYIKKAEEEAKRLAMTKTKVIKIIQEEAEKIGIYPKKVTSAKAGEKFKKNKDAEMQVHKRNNDKRNFNAHNLFKFVDFGITELDELGVPFVNNMVIKEPEYGIFFSDVFGNQAFQRWNDIHKVRIDSLVSYLVMASMIKTLENARFSLKLKKLIAEHPDQEKLQYKKVKLEAVGYMLDKVLML
nr:copia protein [Tanacetum cinerariifolium]